MHRELLSGIHWIQEAGPDRQGIAESLLRRGKTWYLPGRALHIPQNAYLLLGERTLLFDTLSPAASDQVITDLEAVLGDRPLDYLVVSHPDVPHAGNTSRILRRYPSATLVAPRFGETHELYHLHEAMKVGPGDEIDLGGPVARFHEATFLDAAISVWMTEEKTRTLFPVDWMGLPLMDGEFLAWEDELATEVSVDRYTEFHGRVMFWFQYVDVEKTCAEIDVLKGRFAPEHIAPAHGPPIRRDVERFFDMQKEVVTRVAAEGRIGVL